MQWVPPSCPNLLSGFGTAYPHAICIMSLLLHGLSGDLTQLVNGRLSRRSLCSRSRLLRFRSDECKTATGWQIHTHPVTCRTRNYFEDSLSDLGAYAEGLPASDKRYVIGIACRGIRRLGLAPTLARTVRERTFRRLFAGILRARCRDLSGD